jgi:lipid A disaccharide synthetase
MAEGRSVDWRRRCKGDVVRQQLGDGCQGPVLTVLPGETPPLPSSTHTAFLSYAPAAFAHAVGACSVTAQHALLDSAHVIDTGATACMVAGSRRQEIRRHLPVFRDAVAQLQQTHPRLACVVPMLPSLMPEVRTALQRAQWPTPLVVVPSEPTGARYAAMTAGDVALAASGSVALQLAAARVPMVVGYRLHPLTQLLAPLMASVRCVQAEAPLWTPHHTPGHSWMCSRGFTR